MTGASRCANAVIARQLRVGIYQHKTDLVGVRVSGTMPIAFTQTDF